MNRESLDKAQKIIVEEVLKSDIDELDKIELCMNLMKFLEEYNTSIKLLSLYGRSDNMPCGKGGKRR